jgi:hypothetical protein
LIGDELGCLLAETLLDYPILESLNVTGCQLTDKALIPLLYAVMNLPRLETLDLSGNEIDERWVAQLSKRAHTYGTL